MSCLAAIRLPCVTPSGDGGSPPADAPELYLALLARVLTRYELDSPFTQIDPIRRNYSLRKAWRRVDLALQKRNLALVRRRDIDYTKREVGTDPPGDGETMIGLVRLQNLRELICRVLSDDVPGDLLEAGVWRGGASIYMRAALIAYGDPTRDVWLADSFSGLPEPNLEAYPQDRGMMLHTSPYLIATRDQVQENFRRYGLLDEHVHFVEGWFKDTLHLVPVDRLALLRIDGDMYESTTQALEALYDKVSPGGFVVVDDYNAFTQCREATDTFRGARGIDDPLVTIDWTGVYWRKS